jgi:hypothetical protein
MATKKWPTYNTFLHNLRLVWTSCGHVYLFKHIHHVLVNENLKLIYNMCKYKFITLKV